MTLSRTADSFGPSNVSQAVDRTQSKAYRAWLLGILFLINAVNLADRQGMAVTAPAIKQALGLSDTQMGLLQGLGFAIFYTLLGLPIARLAEHTKRTRIIAGSLAIFGVMVSLCGFVRSFGELMLVRIGVGVGDAGFGPPVASLLGDHYPRERRASVNSIIWLGAPIGAVTGAVMGGWLAEHVGWRAAFFAVGIPAAIVALIAFLTLREPPRGTFDAVQRVGPPPSIMTVLRFLLSKPSVRHVLMGAALAAMGMNGLGQFLARFVVANYHLGFAEAGRVMGLMGGVAMASGLMLGGFGVDWAARFDRRWAVWGPAVGLFLAAPFFIWGLAQPTVLRAVPILMAGHVFLFVYYTPTLAMAQNMVDASMRASSAFVVALVLGLVGIGLGPTIIGILSDMLARHAFGGGDYAAMCVRHQGAIVDAALSASCATASATGIRHALMAISVLFPWSALHFALASRHLRQDLDTHYRPDVA
jgi:predicted MFS family arabinose efflux permease